MCAVSAKPDCLAVAERIAAAQSLLLATHVHPDGDGLGGMIALSNTAIARGKRVQLFLPEGVPERYEFLIEGHHAIGQDQLAQAAASAEAIVVLDTSSQSQLEAAWPVLQTHADKTVVVDHHIGSKPIGQLAWVDTSACAVGLMVMEMLEKMNWPICDESARALAVAIASDTGWMRFENTDARCLRAMANLLEMHVRPEQLYSRLFQTDRPQRLALQAKALESMQLHADGAIGTMQLLAADFAQTGARSDETENIVNELLRIPQVQVAIMLVENTENNRVNLRSRGKVDVAAIARKFGGGGHARAAGLRNQTPLPELKNKLIAEAAKALTD